MSEHAHTFSSNVGGPGRFCSWCHMPEFGQQRVHELKAEVGNLRAAIKMAYQCLQRHDYEEAEAALLGTVPDEPAAVVDRELTPEERKA